MIGTVELQFPDFMTMSHPFRTGNALPGGKFRSTLMRRYSRRPAHPNCSANRVTARWSESGLDRQRKSTDSVAGIRVLEQRRLFRARRWRNSRFDWCLTKTQNGSCSWQNSTWKRINPLELRWKWREVTTAHGT